MANTIKKVLLNKKISDVLYDIYPKTSADIVVYNSTTVSEELAALAESIENIVKEDGTIDTKLTELYNKIMGIVDEDTTISEAYDTLKEVADYLSEHGSVVSGFTTDISALKSLVGTAASVDPESGETIGATGLVKDVADLKATVGALGGDVSALHTPQLYNATGDTTDINAAVAALVEGNSELVFGDGDVVVIKDDNGVAAAYQYDSDNSPVWGALDGNVNADNIIFKNDITLAGSYTQVGNLKKGTNETSTLSAAGKSLSTVMQSIFTKELQPTKTDPSVSITFSQAGAYEVGTSVTPSYTATLSAGSYTYGPATGITAKSWSVTDTNSGSKTTSTGSFTSFTVGDTTNYTITATATYDAGASAVTNLGNASSPEIKIAAGSKSKTSGAITGFRKTFHGSKATAVELTSANIRALTGINSSTKEFDVDVVEGTTQVIIAVPTGLTLKSVADTGAFGTDIVDSFVKNTVDVEGANSYTAKEYNVYVYSPAAALGANTYNVVVE